MSVARKFAWGLWLLSLAACRPEGEPRGRALVREALPELEQAFVEVVGESATAQVLANWSATDIAFIRVKNHRLLEHFESNEPIPSVARLFASRGKDAFSTFGEVFGNAYFAIVAEGSGATYYDEIGYDAYNPRGRRPDGLLVRIEQQRLVLLQVFESKLGSHGFDRDQAHNYLETWKRRGILLPVNGVTRHFPPDRISLRSPDGSERSIARVDDPLLEAHTTLVATREHPDFRGVMIPLPCTVTAASEVALRWIELMARGRPVATEHVNFVVPPLDTVEEVDDYRTSLQNWLVEQGRWPKTGNTSGIEHFLAKEISRRGGQTTAFVDDLDAETQRLLAERGLVPVQHPFERRLLTMSPADPGAISALHAYRLHYEKGALPHHSAILAKLARHSPHAARWRQLFNLPKPPPPPSCGPEVADAPQ